MDFQNFVNENIDSFYNVLKELCLIPAPSHHEEKRAEYCKNLLDSFGAKGVYIDEAKNVIYPLNADDSNELTVFVAHTDTVFPDMEPLPYKEEDGNIFCPGVGDDTASAVALMFVAKYFIENNIKPENGILFVCNSCEEGLGNLKGTRQLFKDFEGRIKEFISFDSATLHKIASECVGSHRYEVTVKTKGGHSFGAFGNKNALAELSKIITKIYEINVPEKEGSKTTYNVGEVSGGTSVNTIAQEAKMLCEYRSDDAKCLEIMRKKFEEIFTAAKSDEVSVFVELIGKRPCSEIDVSLQEDLILRCEKIMLSDGESEVIRSLSSTDCNIPLSMGIPAVAVGTYIGGGAHTREEYVVKNSLAPGLSRAIKFVYELTKEK